MTKDSQCYGISPNLPYLNDTLCNNEDTCNHFNPYEAIPPTGVLRIFAWVNWGLAFLSTLLGVIYIYTKWIKEKDKIEGWPWHKKINGIKLSYFKCLPRSFVGFGLIGKLVPSLTMDVIDILTDTLYFNEITQRCGILDVRLHTPNFVFHVLFVFMITGMIKNLGITNIAYRQLTKRLQLDDDSESELVDRNAYMALTFFQGILAFVFQDAVAALIQFFYIDKYVVKASMIAMFNGIIMLVFSLKVLYVFTRYILQYWDKEDPLKVKVFHGIMLSTKVSICVFHFMRNYAVVFSKMLPDDSTYRPTLDMSCFTIEEENEGQNTIQSPFSIACLTKLDMALLASTGIASIGVIICTIVLCFIGFEHFKIFSQSHYSGRVGNITGPHSNHPSQMPELERKIRESRQERTTEFSEKFNLHYAD